MYGTADSDLELFLDKMYELLNSIHSNEDYYTVCGDINADLLNDSSDGRDVINMFSQFGMEHRIREPTCITPTSRRCIDNVIWNLSMTPHWW